MRDFLKWIGPTDWPGAAVLALVLGTSHLLDTFDAWRHQVQALQAAAEVRYSAQLELQAERDYTQFIQRQCGAENWWLPRADGARECTTKHGRRTGQLLAGANP